MPYPKIVSTAANPNKTATIASPAALTLPANILPGRLLIAASVLIDASGHTLPGWDLVASVFSGSGAAQSALWKKIAAGGGDDSASLTPASSGSKVGGAIIFQYDNWSGIYSEVTGLAANGGNVTAAPNPPNLTGAPNRENAWLAVGAGGTTPAMTAPTNYGNLATTLYNGSGSTLATAHREFTGTSQDPSAFGGNLGNPMGLTLVVPASTSGGMMEYFAA